MIELMTGFSYKDVTGVRHNGMYPLSFGVITCILSDQICFSYKMISNKLLHRPLYINYDFQVAANGRY